MASFINKSLYLSYAMPFASRYILQTKLSPICSSFGPNLKNNETLSNVKIDAFNIRLLNVNSKDMNDHQASSASEVTFLNEANKLRNTTLGCVKEASVNKNEFAAAENKDKLDLLLNGAAKIRKKSYKKSKKLSFRNYLQPIESNKELKLSKDNKYEYMLEKPSWSFKEILEQNNAMADSYKSNEQEADKVFDKAAKFYEDKRVAEFQYQRRSPEYKIDWNSAMAMLKETETQLPPMRPTRYPN